MTGGCRWDATLRVDRLIPTGNGTSVVPPTLEPTDGRRFVPVEEPFVRASDLAEVELGLSLRFRLGGRLSGGPMTGDNSRHADANDVQVSCFVFRRYDESNSKNPNSIDTGAWKDITTGGADGCTAFMGAVNFANVPSAHVR